MKKLTLLLAIAFSVATLNGFATDKKARAKKAMPCKAGMSCCKKLSNANAATKATCTKACAYKGKKTS